MQLIINYDQSVNSLPAGFVSDVSYVTQYFDKLFTSPITVTIDLGYGEIAGTPITQQADPNTLGESEVANYITESYTALVNALLAEGAPGASTLPVSPPLSGTLQVATAEAKALGLIANNTGVDGYVGIPTFQPMNYGQGVAAGGEFYFIGVLEHEITEVMGRVSTLNDQPNKYSPIDLFRYSGPGVRDLTTGGAGSTAYFSIDNGNTNLGTWNNNPANGDLADWYPSGPGQYGDDAFIDDAPAGVINLFSPNDVTLMEALGFSTAPAGWTYTTISGATWAKGVNDAGQIVGYIGNGGQGSQGFIYSNGSLKTLSVSSSNGTVADGINDNGVVVGYYYDSSNVQHGFTYGHSLFVPMDRPGASATALNGINNAGQIVGQSSIGSFLYSGGSYSSISDPLAGSQGTFAEGINDQGQIVGYYYDSSNVQHGFIYSGGTYTTVDRPGASGTALYGINNAGVIVGQSSIGSFIYSAGSYTAVTDPSGTLGPGTNETFTTGINNTDQIVGAYQGLSPLDDYPAENTFPDYAFLLTVAQPVQVDYFIASESKTGDYYLGYVVDDQGKYSTGSGFTSNTTDQAGGHWTYYVYGTAASTLPATDNGYVYDTGYWDADAKTGYAPYYPLAGTNFLGTDVDFITENGAILEYGGGTYVPPDVKVDYFIASESKTGDYYLGYVVDDQGTYSTGSGFTSNTTDQAGGHWTYYVYGTAASTLPATDNGYVYDTGYWDADAKTGYAPYYPLAGTSFLGTDVDFITENGAVLKYGGETYVPPDVKIDYFIASESKTGDYYLGYVIDDQGMYSVGSGFTAHTLLNSGKDQAGGNWSFYVYATAPTTPDLASQNGYVYNTGYWDADTKTGYAPVYPLSGTNFLGSNVDFINVNGVYLEYGAAYYVVPEIGQSGVNSALGQNGVADQITIAAGATQEISSAFSGAISFAGSTGALQLDNSSSFSGTVAGLAGQDTLDLRDINPTAVSTPTYSGSTTQGTLTVTDGTHSANIALLGNYIGSTFVSSSDGHGGTSIINLPIDSQNGALASANHA